jgi:hypothetical protein
MRTTSAGNNSTLNISLFFSVLQRNPLDAQTASSAKTCGIRPQPQGRRIRDGKTTIGRTYPIIELTG